MTGLLIRPLIRLMTRPILWPLFFYFLTLAACHYRVEKIPLGSENWGLDQELTKPTAVELSSTTYEEVFTKVLKPKCLGCHDSTGHPPLLTGYQETVSVVNAIHRVVFLDRTMPKKPANKLNLSELKLLRAWIAAGTPLGAVPPTEEPLLATFDSITKHIFAVKCLVCHNNTDVTSDPQKKKAQAILFDTEEQIANSDRELLDFCGHPEFGSLYLAVTNPRKDKVMPPPESNLSPLSQEELKVLLAWMADLAARTNPAPPHTPCDDL